MVNIRKSKIFGKYDEDESLKLFDLDIYQARRQISEIFIEMFPSSYWL